MTRGYQAAGEQATRIQQQIARARRTRRAATTLQVIGCIVFVVAVVYLTVQLP